MKKTLWSDLVVTDEDGNTGNLEELIDDQDPRIRRIVTNSDGSIGSWDGVFISAPGEEPGWDTPKERVDWTDFEHKLMIALHPDPDDRC